jgi:hypothetical protein
MVYLYGEAFLRAHVEAPWLVLRVGVDGRQDGFHHLPEPRVTQALVRGKQEEMLPCIPIVRSSCY